jgi:CheY-like chemotaxis protein
MPSGLIFALVSDLYFIPEIEAAAKKANFSFEWLDSYKPVAEFIELIKSKSPALIILDLNSSIPWPEWLPAAKTDPALAQIPWLAFGSHMNPRRLAAARHAGADKVVPKSQFASQLSDLITGLATK